MLYTRELKEKYCVDVLVVGGGAAGVSAAVAAARQGRSVLLVESTGTLGGLGTSGMVPSFAPFTDGKNIVASGVGLEIRQKALADIPIETYWSAFNCEALKRAYDDIITESNVRLSLFTTVCDAIVHEGHIDSVVCTAKSGMFAVTARIYIDCSGDGDLCAMAGGAYEKGDKESGGAVMPGTLCSLWCGIDWEKTGGVKQNAYIEKAYADGVLTYEDRHLSGFFVGTDKLGGGNIGHLFDLDPTDEQSLTRAMIWGRRSMLEYERYYKEYLKGYEHMQLCATAALPGVRESRRLVCDYTLNIDDFRSRAVFEDEIGRYCYPVDIHVANTDKKEYERFQQEYASMRYQKGESYGIPYRCLISASFFNLLTAGRCVGTDRKLQSSIRVMPGCFITGQAAGAAAALAVDSGETRKVDISALQMELKKLGAYLPNAQ